ncbi:MAG TPA: hypothetical protein VLM89_02975 [Phycisphaerae bacterium]|nr:hypothetical protein [Phycisphaerae bacterium]
MRVLTVNGSPRKDGNTALMLRRVCRPLEQARATIDGSYLEGIRY